jgi:hypothetical protein
LINGPKDWLWPGSAGSLKSDQSILGGRFRAFRVAGFQHSRWRIFGIERSKAFSRDIALGQTW